MSNRSNVAEARFRSICTAVLWYVVFKELSFHCTSEPVPGSGPAEGEGAPGTKPVPVTVKVRSDAPADAALGLRSAITGRAVIWAPPLQTKTRRAATRIEPRPLRKRVSHCIVLPFVAKVARRHRFAAC